MLNKQSLQRKDHLGTSQEDMTQKMDDMQHTFSMIPNAYERAHKEEIDSVMTLANDDQTD